jgi:hypothetical protein
MAKSPSLWNSGLRFSMHQVPIKRSMVLRRVIPRLRKDRKLRAAATAIASPAIGTISKRRSKVSTSSASCSPSRPAAILILAGSAAFLRVRLIESGWMWTVSNW